MRLRTLALVLLLAGSISIKGQSVPPSNEVVRLVSSRDENDAKRIVMRGKEATYVFYCNLNAAGCITPVPGKSYWLITNSSPFRGIDMDFLKNWYVEYHNATNMGIVPTWKEWQEEWGKSKDYKTFMTQYRGVGVYWLFSVTATMEKR